MTDLPFQVDYAKSNKAKCKGCKQGIEKGCLRIAIMVQSRKFDGKVPNWHHEDCFFKKWHPSSVSEISNFNNLEMADKQRMKSRLANTTGIVMPVVEPKGNGGARKRSADDSPTSEAIAQSTNLALKDYLVEYSKNNRATCKHCDIKICKDELRISKTVYDAKVGSGGQLSWHHVKCFAERRTEFNFFAGGDSIPGFEKLNNADQEFVKEEIKPFIADEVPVKILKLEPKNAEELKEEMEKEKKLQKQTELISKYKNSLSELTTRDLKDLLKVNSQQIPFRKNECLDRLADCMAFGALEPCSECEQGQLVLDSSSYKCTGNLTEWSKCPHVIQYPKRSPMIVPKAYKDRTIFKTYEPMTDVRLFESERLPSPVFVKNESIAAVKKELAIPALKNLQFFLYGKLKDKEETKKRILKLGGLVVNKLTRTTVAVVSTKKNVERMPERMEEMKSMGIEVVEESYLDLIEKDGTISKSLELIKENNIAGWGSDPATRVPQDVLDGKSVPKSGSLYVKSSKSSAVKLQIQDGTAVDPDSKLQYIAHVYTDDKGTKYTVALSQTDVVAGKNSYYKMQVLERNDAQEYWFFRSWGRIGNTIGDSKVETCKSVEEAVMKFENLYMKKTKNSWENREDFVKAPGRYFLMGMDNGTDLPEPVQKLINKIFDVDVMKKTLQEFQLDTKKMPLVKLSKKQIKAGYEILSELLKLIDKGSSSRAKLIDATNRFFTLIPHDFGGDNPPLLDNVELIKTKTAMLDNLVEIEIAYSLMKTDSDEASLTSACYLKLKANIAPLSPTTPEFEMIQEYVRNTHSATHSNYTLDIEQVFQVVREGEDKRFEPFKKLHNRRLLWHGSRITNFAGIISQGLRIAPPEAPVSGYNFGKGVYFADMVSKSAHYCSTLSTRSPTGLMMLCEVALGDMKECHKSENVKLPANMHSVWAVGKTQPDPTQNKTLDDGTIVPLGKPVTNPVNTYLLYNEYDVAQVNVKYLVQMKFNYKY